MTGEDIILRAWDMVGDVDTSIQMKRYKLADMVMYLNDGLRDLFSRRPFLLLSATGTVNTFTELTVLTYNTSLLTITESYREPLAHYIASRIYESDSDDDRNDAMLKRHKDLYQSNS